MNPRASDTGQPSHRPHRKTVKHYNTPNQFHELTFSCYLRLKLLTDPQFCLIVLRSIAAACSRLPFDPIAFVLMPEHVHLLVWPTSPEYDISNLLAAIKRPSSGAIKDVLISRQEPIIEKLTVRERPGKTCFRFWQEGSGYDRNITDSLAASIDCIHANPVRRDLCRRASDWPWSSYNQFVDPNYVIPDGFPRIRRHV